MGAELGALGGIEGAFEEGAEDGGVDIAPVLPDGLLQVEEGGAAQLDGFGMVEEIAVEMGDLIAPEKAARGHFGEEIGDDLVEGTGVFVMVIDDFGKGIGGEQVGIFGVEAEDDLVEVTGEALGVALSRADALLHGDDDLADVGGGLFGQLLDGTLRLEGFGMEENVAEFGEGFGFIQVFDGDFVQVGFFTGEVGLDADQLEGGDDEQGRGFEVNGIT